MVRRIKQLTTILDRFKGFNKELDQALISLDKLGELYSDLGFSTDDIDELNSTDQGEFQAELVQHGQMCVGLMDHPFLHILKQVRADAADELKKNEAYETPTGCWQHYKGTVYEMIGPCKSTDHHSNAVLYREKGKPESTIYTITLFNFYSKREVNGEMVSRYTKLA